MDTLLHSHIPYPVILYHAMIVWRRTQYQQQQEVLSVHMSIIQRFFLYSGYHIILYYII